MTTQVGLPRPSRRVQRRGVSSSDVVTMAGALRDEMLAAMTAATGITFPSPRYQADPVAFVREILGVDPWSRQVEILDAIRDHQRGAVASGHKVSKSHTIASVALWYYCSFDDARVVCSSTTARQVDQIIWREVKMVRARGGRCVSCKREIADAVKAGGSQVLAETRIPRPCPHSALIDGDIGELARTGLKSMDFREIVGFTAREAEAVAGISGKNLLYLIDEASGVPQEIFEAIEGNRAGGARLWMFGNPTQNQGEFFDAFHSKSKLYKTIRVSSEETPNVVAGKVVIPGLATREWIEEKRIEWGEDSALYKVRVRGEFALAEEGRIFSVHAIAQAEERWRDTAREMAGRLYVGLDPAGASGMGDETVFCVRRGLRVVEFVAHRGLTDEGHLVHLLSLLGKHRLPRETPVVVLDREGNVGASVYGLTRQHTETRPGAYELIGLRASDRAARQPHIYDRMRDELCANAEAWLRDGGALPEDAKLAAELHALEWKQHQSGRLKVTPKDSLRKELGRSPDRYDALALACWEPLSLRDEMGAPTEAQRVATEAEDSYRPTLDPYAGAGAWR